MKKNIFLSIFACVIAGISFGQMKLSGTVNDVNTKAPIEKAIVNINGSAYTLFTDKNGYFSLNLSQKGNYNVSIAKSKYETLSGSVNVEKDTELTILLKPKTIDNSIISVVTPGDSKVSHLANISGEVRDNTSKAIISDATIYVEELNKKFKTLNNGNFFIRLPKDQKYTFVVEAEGYQKHIINKSKIKKDKEINIFLVKNESENDIAKEFTTEDVVISGTRATDKTPTTFHVVKKEDLEENNLGKDLPYLLEMTPSLVASSDGGSGTGYTSMRIRGSDITRINFTLNGFPVNDAESQGVFLVNTPDLASSVDDIQIQRGVGTSTNGYGAFGASVNINTNEIKEKPFAEINNSYGSFNTLKNTIKVGTGTLFKHFNFGGRFSHISTDGYLDRSAARLFGYAFNAAYFNKKTKVQFNVFAGKERTEQAWNGVDKATMQTNRTFNSSGTDYGKKAEPYNNEIDNYKQENYQLSISHKFTYHLKANLGFHYTKGAGYFEQYKVDEDLIDYGKVGASSSTDLVRRRWLDNNLFGSVFSLNYKKGKINATLGSAWNQYAGDHFGEIIWAQDASNLQKDEKYYFNDALKTDFNVFAKAEYQVIKRLLLFADFQYRRVSYSLDGIDNDQLQLFEDVDFDFYNPKAGITYLLGKKMRSQVYASFAMASREPTRNDFIDNKKAPKPEEMMDFELGFRHQSQKLSYNANAFYMKYKNQLVLTGELNDVGSAVRANVDNSFRTGIELSVAYEPIKYFGVKAVGTWSLNEIEEYSFTDYNGNTQTHDNTKIAYAPSYLGNIELYTKPFKGFKISIINKYVGDQFLDNTNSNQKVLPSYLLTDGRISYDFKPKFMQSIGLVFKVNNIFGVKYSSNGYVYYDTPYFYPQAGLNVEGGVSLKF